MTSKKDLFSSSDIDVYLINMNDEVIKELIHDLDEEDLRLFNSRTPIAIFGVDTLGDDSSRKIIWKYSIFGKQYADSAGLIPYQSWYSRKEVIITLSISISVIGAWIVSLFL